MIRLAKYLKPYLPMVLLTIALLFAQANFDLALPDYLSRIVNVGIQQSGVEATVPEAIRERQMTKVLLFLTPEESEAVLNAYRPVDASSPDYDTLVETYPALADTAIYVLEDVDQATIEALEPPMQRAMVVVWGIEQAAANPARAEELAAASGLDLSQIPPGADAFAVLAQIPPAQRQQMLSGIDEQFAAQPETMVAQAAASAVRAEYEALGMDMGRLQTRYILRVGGMMLGVALLSGAAIIGVGYLSARIAAAAARDIRGDLFRKVESFSSAEFITFPTASLITRSTNDITQVQMVTIILLRMAVFAPIIGIGGVIRAIGKGGSMWWLIAVAVAILLGLVLAVMIIALPKFRLIQDLIDRLNQVSRENLAGMLVIRAFNRQPFEEERFDGVNRDLTDISRFINRLMVIMMPTMMLIMNGLSIAIIWVGAHQIAEAQMQVGDMIAFTQYAMQIVMSFLMLTMLFIFLPRASVSADRIADVLETEPAITDPEEPVTFPEEGQGVVEFHDVSFRYPGAEDNVLCNITFTAQPGQTTAIIGSTGCGKSTLINLIPRFYDVTEGAVLIDGVDVRKVTQRDLRDRIGYIPQTGVLFSGTVASNLAFGDENADAEALREAVEVAQAADFVFTNPEGLDAPISQGGTNVSGGQKQRLSIARALVKKPAIFIFDDSFSALDFKTESALRAALWETTGESTILVVTQRVSPIIGADQIIVLEEGEIVGKGTHDELMETCEPYREIALSQLSMEELA